MFFTLLWQKLDQGLRHALPLLSSVIFILLSVIPWPLPYLGSITPALIVIAVYYWATHRPDCFFVGSAFVLGLIHDAVNGFPIGASALVITGVYQLSLTQRRFFVGHGYFMFWVGFALIMGLMTFMLWLILSLWFWQALPILPLTLQALLTIAFFPIPALFLAKIQRLLPSGI